MLGRTILRDDHIHVQYSAVADGADVLARAREVADLLARGAPRRVLIDARDVVWTFEPDGADTAAETVLDLLPRDVRFAVWTAQGLESSLARPLNVHMRDAGYAVGHFRRRGAALDWLLGDDPPPAPPA